MEASRDNNPFDFPPALMTELEAAADEQRRPIGDVVREFVEQGLGERRWKTHAEQERQRARALGLPDDDQPMTEEYRQTLREQIAQGITSARAGRFVEGEAVFARIKAEMVERERQGSE
jgi:predicted transcriptional regulator